MGLVDWLALPLELAFFFSSCPTTSKSSAGVICTEDEHLHSLSRSLGDKVDDRQALIPCFLARPFVQRKPPVLRRPEAASHHSLATRSA